MSLRPSLALLLLALSAAPAAAQATASTAPITIGETFTLSSKVLGQDRRINVFLPAGYREGQQRYPVMYLLDGGVQEDFLHIMGIASLAADWRGLREFILVGIENFDGRSRYHDFVHPSSVAEERQRLPNHGGSAAFRTWLEQELIGEIGERYRVTDERVIIGESAAGMFVLETLLRQPSLFTGYIAISPMLWWDNQSLSREAATLLRRRPFPPHRQLYLSIADEGGAMREGTDRVAAALASGAPPGLSWTYVPMTGETHATTFHPVALAAVRKFFALPDSAGKP
jgi:predicted alpha/beta superfamily hydrolase